MIRQLGANPLGTAHDLQIHEIFLKLPRRPEAMRMELRNRPQDKAQTGP